MKNFIHISSLHRCCLLLMTMAMVCIYGNSNAQVNKLSSYPAANAVIFLDFDGHTVEGTSWNSVGPLVCGPSGLNDDQITEVFNRVAEDYRPFNINVTTDSTKFLAAPFNQRTRVILTVTHSWYPGAGGVSFQNTFTWGDDTPCFVFTAALTYTVKQIAEATSHEAGHTLGLYHQAQFDGGCNKLSEYYQGVGTGEIGWAPIMGNSYYKNFTLWNNGPTPYSCTNFQNDLQVITSSANGFGYRTDDHGSSFTGATPAYFAANHFTLGGVVEKNTDADMFRFTIPQAATFALDAIPYNVGTGNAGSDLDMQVTLYDAAENVLNIYNPGALLNSLVDTILAAGDYYIKVEGKGNQFAPSYASLGSYSLQGNMNIPNGPLAVKKIELHGAKNGDVHQFKWEIEADEKVLYQELQIATDGRHFLSLTKPAAGINSYIYRTSEPASHYRLHVIFENGREHYSNVIYIDDQTKVARPQISGNLIHSKNIYVSSPGNFSYTLIDFQGKMIAKGNLIAGMNTISASTITNGMYVMRYYGNNETWTDKILIP